MLYKRMILTLLGWFCMLHAFPQGGSVLLFGKAAEYAGDSLSFYTYTDYFVRNQEIVSVCKVAADGSFRAEFKLNKTTRIFAETGVYRGQIFAEPGKKYELKLPPKMEKTSPQLLNPFFQPIEYYFGIINQLPGDINQQVFTLDQSIDSFLEVHQYELLNRKQLKPAFESFRASVLQNPAKGYLETHRMYRIAQLEQFFYPASKKEIIRKYLKNYPVAIDNQAYCDFISAEFKLYFGLYKQTVSSDKLLTSIRDGNLNAVRDIVELQDNLQNATLRDLLISKGLYDGFIAGHYSSAEVIPLITLLSEDGECDLTIRRLAVNMIIQITTLLPNYPAPSFALPDQNKRYTYLEEYKGKYLYLSFVSKDSYPFRQDLELLKMLQKEFSRNLEIVSISVDPDFEGFVTMMEKQGCQWTFLQLGNQHDLIRKYKAKSIPSYYLIDPYGKIVRAPALSPQEDFQNEFYGILNKRD